MGHTLKENIYIFGKSTFLISTISTLLTHALHAFAKYCTTEIFKTVDNI